MGAGLAALIAFALVQPALAGHGGGDFHGGGFQSAPMMHGASRPAMPMQWGGQRGGGMRRGGEGFGGAPFGGAPFGGAPGGRSSGHYSGHYGGGPMRVADQGGWRERQGARQQERRVGGFNNDPPYGNGFGGYHGPIQPVSAEARQVPRPPADSPVRAGSIREDVARYNEERSSYRPFQRGGGEVPRPPMPAPYRN
ncbi:hypothetical protein [Paraburkholderia sacchari]|uniref:hypothetical protein n=1 Tax=Paraburkholderia sacchari TaxID=159450 RepID=UPI0039A767E5